MTEKSGADDLIEEVKEDLMKDMIVNCMQTTVQVVKEFKQTMEDNRTNEILSDDNG